eukprot:scaffold120405_cov26-Tisochrysis_lutea.AAC.2
MPRWREGGQPPTPRQPWRWQASYGRVQNTQGGRVTDRLALAAFCCWRCCAPFCGRKGTLLSWIRSAPICWSFRTM